MITGLPARTGPTAVARHLDAVVAALATQGTPGQVTDVAGTPVLTTGPGQGPNAATAAIDPSGCAGLGLRLDCTCVWTPPPGTTAEDTAAVLAAASPTAPGQPRRPRPSDAGRLAGFLRHHPGWSAFWDPRYGLWRAAEDDPSSPWYAETPDADAIIDYITSRP